MKTRHCLPPYLDEGHVLLGDGAVARVEVGLVEEEVVDVESPRETDLVILQTWAYVKWGASYSQRTMCESHEDFTAAFYC